MSLKNSKWTPATPIRPKNFIISSDAAANGIKSFTPSYENESHPVMRSLMSNDYMKMWFAERSDFEKHVYHAGLSSVDPRQTKKFIPKPKPKSRIRELPIIKLKEFQNIPSKTDSGKHKTSNERKN